MFFFFAGERGVEWEDKGEGNYTEVITAMYQVPQARDCLWPWVENRPPVFIQDEREVHANHLDLRRGYQDPSASLMHFQSILSLMMHIPPLLEVLVPSKPEPFEGSVRLFCFFSFFTFSFCQAQDSAFSDLLRLSVTYSLNCLASKMLLQFLFFFFPTF